MQNQSNCGITFDTQLKTALIYCSLLYFLANRIRLITPADDIGGGRVEVFHNGQWGTVCDKGWSQKEAEVVCKELGYKTALYPGKKALFGKGSGQVMDIVPC